MKALKVHYNKIIFLLFIIIIVLIAYIIYQSSYQGMKNHYEQILEDQNESFDQEKQTLAENSFNLGYEQAVVELINQAVMCKPVPIYYDNITLTFIALECLNYTG